MSDDISREMVLELRKTRRALYAVLLVAQEPHYYYGHAYLGAVYLAMGDATNAQVEYQRAYELSPNDETEKDLAAVRKRVTAGPGFKLISK